MMKKVTFVGFVGDPPNLGSAPWSRQWWPTNPKDIFSVTLTLCNIVLVLNALVRKSSNLQECDQTHNAAMFTSKCETFALHVRDTSFCWTSFSC